MPATVTQDAIVGLGRWLQAGNYRFTSVTPATHARVNARADCLVAQSLRDVFGWSRPFDSSLLPQPVLALLRHGQLLETSRELQRSKVRFSTLDDLVFAHSAYPTIDPDSVFFGPDTFRFCRLIQAELAAQALKTPARILDVGCGAGPGGLIALRAIADATAQICMADINPRALEYAAANSSLANVMDAEFRQSDLFSSVEGLFDLIVANPPYLMDPAERVYRHGGGALGTGLGERIVAGGLPRLAPRGRLILYTGVPIIEGRDPFLATVQTLLQATGCRFSYRELDPDVFGEELDLPVYARAHTERIAAVALVVEKPAS
jgi:methylase of polypeptide subunit release factors